MTIEAVKLNTEFEDKPWDIERWKTLRNRLADEMAQGPSIMQIAIETKPTANIFRAPYDSPDSWKASIEAWAKDGSRFREPGRHYGEPSLAEKIETALQIWFDSLDRDRAANPPEPGFVATSVSRNIVEGFQSARTLAELVEIETPPGSGKSFTTDYYLSQCRKAEGFDCPVWSIALRETNCTLKIILLEIAQAMHGNSGNGHMPEWSDGEYSLGNQIERMALERKGGLLIIDEAQNMFEQLKGATQKHGLTIINELRRFTDHKLFGIALLSNGEIFQQAKRHKSAQLVRRMEAWRINAKKPTADDVDLIMAAWNVTGKAERAWSVTVGMGEGGLGSLTAIYRAARKRFPVVNHAALSRFRKE